MRINFHLPRWFSFLELGRIPTSGQLCGLLFSTYYGVIIVNGDLHLFLILYTVCLVAVAAGYILLLEQTELGVMWTMCTQCYCVNQHIARLNLFSQ